MSDAFLSAEACSLAIDHWLSGRSEFEAAMAAYQSARDERALPRYEFTCQFAALAPPPPELQRILAACHGNQEAMDGFAQAFSGVISPSEFFSPENVSHIFAAAAP
jgi:hypothetical protein